MKGDRFLVIIAHPLHGRIKRLHIPHAALHFAAGAFLLVAIAGIGLGASYLKKSAETDRLTVRNTALEEEYDNLLVAVEERDFQIASLRDLAYQVSIAYGVRRDEFDAETAYGNDPIPAYYASRSQYEQLREVLSASHREMRAASTLANGTPSIWPVKGHITSSYGKRQDPFSGAGAFHPGLDISAPYGSPVLATADGYVESATWDGGLGHSVKIRHGADGFRTIYGHLKEYLVRAGQSVRRGEVIGLVGSSGRTTGQHVHYEVHYNDMKVNPYKYLRNAERTYSSTLAD